MIFPSLVTVGNVLKILTPVTSRQYWYLSAYLGLLFLMPLLNYCLDHLEGRFLNVSVITIMIVFSVLPTLRHSDPFALNDGWSSFWLAIMYYLGGYAKKTQLCARIAPRKGIFLFILTVAFASGSKFFIEFMVSWWTNGNHIAGGGYFISMTSPVIIAESIFLIAVFEKMNIPETPAKVISAISATTLGVYIIHQHPFIKKYLIKQKFAVLGGESPWGAAIMMIIASAGIILLICSLIDYLRNILFNKLSVKEKINRFKIVHYY